ncbi:hypothetical protein SynRS9915_00166 [Synechococcus sp. RS9915]|nr:hypothetical protein SynRS9915_00166 [Synechococcus sp. RS9915]
MCIADYRRIAYSANIPPRLKLLKCFFDGMDLILMFLVDHTLL